MRWLALAISVLTAGAAYADPPAKPLVAWPAGPMEVRVTFDEPVDAAVAAKLVGRTIPYYGSMGVRATGAKHPMGPALGALRIAGSKLVDGDRTLILATDPHPRQAYYDLTNALELRPSRDPLVYSLSGVEATWDDGTKDAAPSWSGWLPGVWLDSTGRGPTTKEPFIKPGRLIIKGSFSLPKGKHKLTFTGSSAYTATVNGGDAKPVRTVGQTKLAELVVESDGTPFELVAIVPTGPTLNFAMLDQSEPIDPKVRGAHLPADVVVPWAPNSLELIVQTPPPPFELKGGDRKKGEAVFVSEAAKCSACHAVGGKGGKIGPNLDWLKGRDLAEVYFHVAEPSARIVPDYLTYTVARKNGQIVVGVVKAEGFDMIKVTDIGAQSTMVPKVEIEELRPSATSIMPVGLPGALGEANMRDLLAFLTQKE